MKDRRRGLGLHRDSWCKHCKYGKTQHCCMRLIHWDALDFVDMQVTTMHAFETHLAGILGSTCTQVADSTTLDSYARKGVSPDRDPAYCTPHRRIIPGDIGSDSAAALGSSQVNVMFSSLSSGKLKARRMAWVKSL